MGREIVKDQQVKVCQFSSAANFSEPVIQNRANVWISIRPFATPELYGVDADDAWVIGQTRQLGQVLVKIAAVIAVYEERNGLLCWTGRIVVTRCAFAHKLEFAP